MSRSKTGGSVLAVLAAGTFAALALRAVSQNSQSRHPADSAPGSAARQSRFGNFAVSANTVTIARPRQELYAFWRDFSNLSEFMENVVSIELTGEKRARWTLKAPAGRTITLETDIVSDRENEEIAWRSVDGSDIEAEGKVSFTDAPADRGTIVRALVAYVPPAGELGRWIAKMFGREPNIQGRRELKRFKMLMETGEIADSRYTLKGE